MGRESKTHRVGQGSALRRVTIADLADAVGLAKGTVSRALNDYPDISPSTKKRVAVTALKMGYTPHTHAQAIKTGRVRALGLVLQIDQHDAQAAFLAEFLAGVTQSASREGWTLTMATAVSEADGLDVMRRLIAERKADGFVLPRVMSVDKRVKLLRDLAVPFVLYGRTIDDRGCAWFDIRGEDAMAEAVARLVTLGHTRIGFLAAGEEFNFARLRHDGYRAGLQSAGLPYDETLISAPVSGEDEATMVALRLLSRPDAPTALVCATDRLAIGATLAVQAKGLRPGREVSIIGYDGLPDGARLNPPLSTFEVDQFDVGDRLARLLISAIRGADPETLRETAPARFRAGGTIGPNTNKIQREDFHDTQ